MRTSVVATLRGSGLLILGAVVAVSTIDTSPASATPPALTAWQNVYTGMSTSDAVAQCQLCHAYDPADTEWNGYGWDIRTAIGDLNCDGADGSAADGSVSLDEAFACVEALDSDMDPGASDNLTEILGNAQPGWTAASTNTIYTFIGDMLDQSPFAGLEPYDPSGAGGAGGMGGMGGIGGAGGTGCPREATGPFEPFMDGILVKQNQSIQEAIDLSEEGTRIYIEPGIYEEPCNPTNGLNITKNGIQLIGLSTAAAAPDSPDEGRVIVRSTGDPQRNGIVFVPPVVPLAAQPKGREVERTDCMGCHSDMAPPFPLHPDVPNVILKQEDPWLFDIVVRSITIEGFSNNGLFTEHVDGFEFDDVESINNRNYGIFPVLSKNGLIQNSYSTGSDLDSALWVETSENVDVFDNVVENSVNGIEVSNSDNVLVMGNVSRDNTVGAAILLLPDIFNNRGSAKGINLVDNDFINNNKPNTARPTSILGFIPRGIGILYVGVDDSLIEGNLVEDNDFIGIGIIDYCLALGDTQFGCPVEPNEDFPAGFLLDQIAENNRIVGNTLVNNGTNPDPSDFQDFAADLSLLTLPDHNNCFSDNVFTTFFSSLQVGLPPCPDEPGTGGAGGGAGGAGGSAGSGGTGGADEGDGGGGCTVGSAAAPSGRSTAWLALLCCAGALLLRRRSRRLSRKTSA